LHPALLVVTWMGTRSSTRPRRRLRSSSDTYDIYYQNPALLPPIPTGAADYPPGEVWTLEEGRQASIEDVCQFIVEYINSDVMVRHLHPSLPPVDPARYTAYRAYWLGGIWLSQINQR
jgi:hypothetical protein